MEKFKEIKKSIPLIVTLGLLLGIIAFPLKGFIVSILITTIFLGIFANIVLLLEFINTTRDVERKCDIMHHYESHKEVHRGVYKGFRR
jgi:diacylglycerol kinase